MACIARVLAGDVLHKRARARPGRDVHLRGSRRPMSARLLAGELVADRADVRRSDAPADRPARRPPSARTQILAAAGLAPGSFAKVRAIAEGTRRDATIEVTGVTVAAADGETIEVEFTLPGGAYATAVMREVMKTHAGPSRRHPRRRVTLRGDGSLQRVCRVRPARRQLGAVAVDPRCRSCRSA